MVSLHYHPGLFAMWSEAQSPGLSDWLRFVWCCTLSQSVARYHKMLHSVGWYHMVLPLSDIRCDLLISESSKHISISTFSTLSGRLHSIKSFEWWSMWPAKYIHQSSVLRLLVINIYQSIGRIENICRAQFSPNTPLSPQSNIWSPPSKAFHQGVSCGGVINTVYLPPLSRFLSKWW